MSQSNSYFEALTPNVTAFTDKTFREVTEVNVIKERPYFCRTDILIKTGRNIRHLSLSMNAKRKGPVRTP